MLFVDKYAPKTTKDMVGNEKAISTVKVAVLNWLHNRKKKPVLVYGPPGVGKTALAYAIANELDLDVIEINASDMRNKKTLASVFSSAKNSMTLFGKKRLILIDDVDALSPVDRGAAGEILRLIKTSGFPIILTANDAWNKKISKIRLKSQVIQFRRITSASILKYISKIAAHEHITGLDLESISRNANGDMRAAINDLQARVYGKRDVVEDIFTKVRTVFKSATYADALSASKGNVDVDMLMMWMDENIPKEYTDIDDLNRAYYWLSLASLYRGRIQTRNYWGYLRYVFDFVTAGVSLSKKHVYRKFTKYSFPTYISAMSRTMLIRSMKRSIGVKLSQVMHASRTDSLMFLIVLKLMMENCRTSKGSDATNCEISNVLNAFKDVYDFTDSEIEFINSILPESLYI